MTLYLTLLDIKGLLSGVIQETPSEYLHPGISHAMELTNEALYEFQKHEKAKEKVEIRSCLDVLLRNETS